MTQAADHGNWIDAWLETQRGWVGRWQAVTGEQRIDAVRAAMATLHEHLNPAAFSPAALNVVQSFQILLQSCMAHAGELAGMVHAGVDAAQNPLRQMLDMYPVGPAREHQVAWQTYLKALAEYQICQQALLQAYGQVFTQSLQAVPEQAEARAARGEPITGIRDLYEVWIRCGEKLFASRAREPDFIAAQTAAGNALSRLKLAQQVLLEQWLKAHDLPTRSELNSVHLRLRELTGRMAALERQLSPPAEPGPSTGQPRRAARRVKSSGRA